MNLTTVKIRRLDLTNTLVDPDFGDNLAVKARQAEESFSAQIRWRAKDRRVRETLGNTPWTDGYLVYRAPATVANRLKKGDQITAIPNGAGGFDTVDYIITENRPAGHLPGPLLFIAYFKRNEDVVNSP